MSGICLLVLTRSALRSDRICVDFDGFIDDDIGRNLLAQIMDCVTIVGKNGFDKVLSDIVDVSKYGRKYDRSLTKILGLIEELLRDN